MSRLEMLLQRMPAQFSRDPESNNYKLLSLVADGSEENQIVYDTILKFWDVDQAEGIGLDRLGKDEGISRGGMDDEEYRKMIKIQCILNMSDGDIPTINTILDAYMGERYIGAQDAFSEMDLPATILANVSQYAGKIPDGLAKRIKSAGVSFYWLTRFAVEQLNLAHYSYVYPVLYPICGYHWTEGIKGMALESVIGVQSNPYHYPVLYPIANDFTTVGVCGEFYGGGY